MKKITCLVGSLLLCLTVVPVVSAESLMGDSVVPTEMQKDDGCNQKDDDCMQKNDCKIAKDCMTDCYCEPLWTFRAGILVLKRESPIKSGYKGYDFDYEAGVDVGAIRRLGDCHALEFRYFGIDQWSDSESYTTGGFIPFTFANSYLSKLHSTELNLRRHLGERVDVLAGFRWVELHEEFAASITPFPGNILNTNVDNHMYGFQLGADATIWDRGGPLQVTSGVKAGVYYNDADATGALLIFPGSEEEAHTSFLGELDVVARLALTDCLALRVGYEMMWLEGVAGAGGQLGSALQGQLVDTASSPFYHGAILGVELTH